MPKMIFFPFATQATEPAPGASIEEPRLLLDVFFTDRKHKQTQANTGSTQTEHTHRHPREHQRAREPRQARSQRPQETRTRADRAPGTERHKDSQDSRPQPATESTGVPHTNLAAYLDVAPWGVAEKKQNLT